MEHTREELNPKGRISAVVNTYNEQDNIARCLESLIWADEIVVVDMHSTDDTVKIARQYTNKIFYFDHVGYVEPARNFALSMASYQWIILLDADEVVSPDLADALKSKVAATTSPSAYQIARKNIIFGQWMQHAGWWPDYQIRFFIKGAVEWSDDIHSIPQVKGTIGRMPSDEHYAIEHYSYKSRREFVEKMNNYTDKEVDKLKARNARYSLVWAIYASVREFLVRYVKKQGFRDGKNGFILSVYMAFYYFLAWTKLLDMDDKNV